MRPVPAHPARTDASGHNPVRRVMRRPWSPTSPWRSSSTTPAAPSARWPTPTTRAAPRTSACSQSNVDAWSRWQLHPAGPGRDLGGLHRHHRARHARQLARRRRPDGHSGAGPPRGRGGHRPGRRRGGRAADPVLARHPPARGRGGRRAGGRPLDADLRTARAGAHRRAGAPGGRRRLPRPRAHRRRPGLGPPPARVARRRAPARRPGTAQPGGRQHREGAGRWLHGRRDQRVRPGAHLRRRGVAGRTEHACPWW